VLALTGVAVAALAAAVVIVTSSGGGASASVVAPDSVGALSPPAGSIVADAPLGFTPTSLAAGAGSVWATTSDNTVSRIDPSSRAVVQTIPVGSNPSAVAVGAGAVWVANNLSGTVSRIDPAAGRVVQTIPVGNAPAGIAVGYGSVWVTNGGDDTVSRIDSTSGVAVRTIQLGVGATGVVAALGGVWVTDEAAGRVLRIDPETDDVTQAITVGTGPTAIASADGAIWVANSLDGTVSRIDPATNTVVATIAAGDGPDAIADDAGGVWVSNEFTGTLSRIDTSTDTVTRTVRLGNRPLAAAISNGLLWVGAQAPVTAHRGGTLVLLTHAPYGGVNPNDPTASLASGLTWFMTSDGLTNFKQVGGSGGVQVVPDLAVSLPTPTDGGTTYTFQLRTGIRYSNGQPLRPADFLRAFERLAAVNPGYISVEYGGIVGAAACVAHPSHCDFSRGIVPDAATNSVTIHLVAPDPEFLEKLALQGADAVPVGTPLRDPGTRPLPGTGPYEIVKVTRTEVRLARNPYFREWSRAAHPDGFPDEIVWRIGGSVQADVTAVERGTADYTLDPPPPGRLQEVATRFANQLNVNPNPVVDTLALNTRVAPFTDVRVRRALNYAVDRARVARLIGADSVPSCQMLPPYIPGYRRYCPYTVDPNAAGIWHGPDLAKARALTAASGSRGAKITVWSQPNPIFVPDYDPVGRYLVSLLRSLGYQAKLKSVSAGDKAYNPLDPRQRVQAFLGVDYPLYPSASEFIGPQWVGCESFKPDSANTNPSELCDPQVDATAHAALAAEAAGSPDATSLWAKADRQLTDEAAYVSLVTPSTTDFVSRRVGNYQYNPVQGVLLDQLWVR
jgi:peptide/nickel transport system substrate-binding protein